MAVSRNEGFVSDAGRVGSHQDEFRFMLVYSYIIQTTFKLIYHSVVELNRMVDLHNIFDFSFLLPILFFLFRIFFEQILFFRTIVIVLFVGLSH